MTVIFKIKICTVCQG